MNDARCKRVAKQILTELSAIVERDLSDPRLGVLTFTGARVSPDLRIAWLRFSCLDAEHTRDDCEQALTHATGYLRRVLGQRLRLRYVPALRFEYDDSAVRAERIARLLGQQTRGRGADETDEE